MSHAELSVFPPRPASSATSQPQGAASPTRGHASKRQAPDIESSSPKRQQFPRHLSSPFAASHKPLFLADRGLMHAQQMALHLSQQEEASTAALTPTQSGQTERGPGAATPPPTAELPRRTGQPGCGPQDPAPAGLHLPTLHASSFGQPGCKQCLSRAAFEAELWRRRCQAEEEYTSRLRALAEAARTIESVLRSNSGSSAADSGRDPADLEVLVALAVTDVQRALERDQDERDKLRLELRAATEAYTSGVPSTRPATVDAAALQKELAGVRAKMTLQQATMRTRLRNLTHQLQAEREAYCVAMEQGSRHFNQERWGLVAQLRAQSTELALLSTGRASA